MNQRSSTTGRQLTRIRFTANFIAVVQAGFGLAFLFAPVATARVFGFPPAPGWAYWLLGMMAARFLGYAIGLFLAARQPYEHRVWIQTMLGVQLIDWLLTMIFIFKGDISFGQVPTAVIFPVLWIALLLTNRKPWTEAALA